MKGLRRRPASPSGSSRSVAVASGVSAWGSTLSPTSPSEALAGGGPGSRATSSSGEVMMPSTASAATSTTPQRDEDTDLGRPDRRARHRRLHRRGESRDVVGRFVALVVGGHEGVGLQPQVLRVAAQEALDVHVPHRGWRSPRTPARRGRTRARGSRPRGVERGSGPAPRARPVASRRWPAPCALRSSALWPRSGGGVGGGGRRPARRVGRVARRMPVRRAGAIARARRCRVVEYASPAHPTVAPGASTCQSADRPAGQPGDRDAPGRTAHEDQETSRWTRATPNRRARCAAPA